MKLKDADTDQDLIHDQEEAEVGVGLRREENIKRVIGMDNLEWTWQPMRERK